MAQPHQFREDPTWALIVPGIVRYVLAAAGRDGDEVVNIGVFGAVVSYALLTLPHIVLHKREPELHRPYRTPGGVLTTGIGLVLVVIAVATVFFVDIQATAISAGTFVIGLLYFAFHSLHHVVTGAGGGIRTPAGIGGRAAVRQ